VTGLVNKELGRMLKDSVEAKSDAFSRHLTGETEKIHDKYQLWYPVSGRRFEPGISRIRSKEFTILPRPSEQQVYYTLKTALKPTLQHLGAGTAQSV
jgi:hypothetical protein